MGVKVKTNNVQDSVNVVTVKTLDFVTLWNNYPSRKNVEHNVKAIDDYCAVNVSEAILKSGIKMKSFTGSRCWGECPNKENYRKHAIRARELSSWLELRPIVGCPKAEEYTGKDFKSKIDGRTGIIYFEDYWIDSNEQRTGDHIDLWDGRGIDKLASQKEKLLGLANFFTNSIGLYWDGFYSNKELSKKVLFWEIK
jgi:hypothetical protein